MVLACCDKVLPFKVQQLQVVLVCVPQVAKFGLQVQLKAVAAELGIFNFYLCVASFASAVSVPKVESNGYAGLATPVAASCVAVCVVFAETVAIACV